LVDICTWADIDPDMETNLDFAGTPHHTPDIFGRSGKTILSTYSERALLWFLPDPEEKQTLHHLKL
jgi:hypothetical protein